VKSVKSCVAYLTEKLHLALQLIHADRAKICQGQLPPMYSECSSFHPNRFTFGRVIAERVNTLNELQICNNSVVKTIYVSVTLHLQRFNFWPCFNWNYSAVTKMSLSYMYVICRVIINTAEMITDVNNRVRYNAYRYSSLCIY